MEDDEDEIGFFFNALQSIDISIQLIHAENGERGLHLLHQLL